jgi:putative phosphonate metabolism protein
MSEPVRYALYFNPEPGSALDRLGASVLGYDSSSGEAVPQPALPGIDPAQQEQLTAQPRHYGFHATLKAPFRLRAGFRPAALLAALRDFAGRQPPVRVGPVALAELGSFLALTPVGDTRQLDLFAAEIVAVFDEFRAALSAQERARRSAGCLSQRQETLLERWGYPFVFNEFRFHMTLTGSLPEEARAAWAAALREHCADLEPVTVDAISLLRQDHPASRFRVVERVPLTGLP